VEVVAREGEPTGLIDTWEPADEVWLVDAVSSGAAPGTVHRIDASERELPAEIFRASTHHLGVPEAVELARALGRLPRRVIVYGVEGADFDAGRGITPEVDAAADQVVAAVREEVGECTRRR
jgi:hydrogenase maturation protease